MKHTPAFQKSSETNRHQTHKHLRQHLCYGIVFREGRCTFRDRGDIYLYPASRETTRTKKTPKDHIKMLGQNISSSLQKKMKHTHLFHHVEQLDRLHVLLAVKMIWQQISLSNWINHQSTAPPTNKRRPRRTLAKHRWLLSGRPLMTGLGIHTNIPVYYPKFTPGLWTDYIIAHLTADEIFPVNQRTITDAHSLAA